jgi:hypothetical protein
LIGEGASERSRGLRVRGLAVGSSLLPWAHHQLAAIPGLVKGLVGLGSAAVCSRAARSSFAPPTPKLDTAAPSVGPPRGDGVNNAPAGTIARPPTVGNSDKLKPDGIAAAAPNAAAPHRPSKGALQHPILGIRARCRPARVSAQPGHRICSAATAQAATSRSHALTPIPLSGFVARLAVRRCGASSNGNGGGATAPVTLGAGWAPTVPEGLELRGTSFPRSHYG